MIRRALFSATLMGAFALAANAADLREATFTQIINSVTVSRPGSEQLRPAQVNSRFATPEVIRTGADSRAELTAADQTVTRVGANTIFSFKPQGRGINLQQGSVLFNSPTGRGGGTIQTAAATASVLGTTIIVSTTRNGGFKLLVIEGKAKGTLPNGRSFTLKGGQMTFIFPGMKGNPQVFEFRLSKQADGSKLLSSFTQPLPSQNKVEAAIQAQEERIASGKATDTGLMLGDVNGNEAEIIDPNTIQVAHEIQTGSDFSELINKFLLNITIDRTISSPTLNPEEVLFFPTQDSLFQALKAGNSHYENENDLSQGSYVYAAKNLFIPSGSIDLSPYTAGPSGQQIDGFHFYADQAININGSVTFNGNPGEVGLHSNGTFTIQNYASLNFNCDQAVLEAYDPATFSLVLVTVSNSGSIEIQNKGGGLSIQYDSIIGGGYTSLSGAGAVDIANSSVEGSGVSVSAGGDLTLGGTNFFNGDMVTLNAGGTTTFSGGTYDGTSFSSYSANNLFVMSGSFVADNVVLSAANNVVITSAPVFNPTTSMMITAGADLTLTNVTLNTLFDTLYTYAGNTATFSGSSIMAKDVTSYAYNNFVSTNTDFIGDDVSVGSVVGTVNITNGVFTATNSANVWNTSGSSIAVNGTSFVSPGGGGSATFSANMTSGTISMVGANFDNGLNSFSSVSMAAYTIFLDTVGFANGQTLYFQSGLGGGIFFATTPTPGRTTFKNVTYNGTLLNSGNVGSFPITSN